MFSSLLLTLLPAALGAPSFREGFCSTAYAPGVYSQNSSAAALSLMASPAGSKVTQVESEISWLDIFPLPFRV